jgi:hypothetical protein
VILAPGSIVTTMASALSSSTGIATSIAAVVPGPLAAGLMLAFAWRGVRIAGGEPAGVLWKHALVGLLIYVWVRDLSAYLVATDALFLGVPARLVAATFGATGSLGSTEAIAAMLDQLATGVEHVAAMVGQTFSLTPSGIAQAAIAFLVAWASGVLLSICGVLYVASLFILRVMQCVGPVLLAMAAFYSLRPFWERWLGVCISLVLVQVMGFITLQVVLLSDQVLLAKITTALLASITDRAAGADALQGLGAMCAVILAGTVCLFGVALLAFSIGGGMAPAMVPGWGRRLSFAGGPASGPALPPPPAPLSLSVAGRPPLGLPNPERRVQAPAPPPSIAVSSR